MTPSGSLFELVKTLDHGEIKHFRRQSRRNPNQGTNNYLRLFEVLLVAKEYDEARVKKQFEGEGLEKHFANVKRYLYKQLLEFLAAREAEKDPRGAMELQMAEAEVLWKKGLYQQSAKIYEKTAGQAQRAGLFDIEIRALTLLQRDRVARLGKSALDSLDDLGARIRKAGARAREQVELSLLDNKLFLLTRQYFGVARPEGQAIMAELMQHPLLQGKLEDLDFFEGKRLYQNCHCYEAIMNGDRKAHARIRKQIVATWEAQPEMIRRYRNKYRLDIANQLGADGALMDFTDFPASLEKLRSLPASTPDEEGEVFQNTAFFELLFLMNTSQFETALRRLPDIEKGLNLYADKVNQARYLAFRYNMMVLHFVLEDYSAALRQLNLILHDERTEHRQDLQQVARLFLLIFHFELGNLDLLEYLFRSAYRYLYSRGSLGRFERAVLAFLRKTASLPPGKAMFPAYEQLLGELKAILTDRSEPTPLGTDEMVYWLRSRLEGRPIQALLREE